MACADTCAMHVWLAAWQQKILRNWLESHGDRVSAPLRTAGIIIGVLAAAWSVFYAFDLLPTLR